MARCITMGDMIQDLRMKHHLTQKEFGELFGVSYQLVGKWENDICDISDEKVREICKHFDVDYKRFMDHKIVFKHTVLKIIIVIGLIIAIMHLLFF